MENTINSMEVNVAEVLREALKQGKVNFEFRKKDGTRRPAVGTLNLDDVPDADKQFKGDGQKEERDDQVTYYDCEKGAWRCCKTDSILTIEGKEVV